MSLQLQLGPRKFGAGRSARFDELQRAKLNASREAMNAKSEEQQRQNDAARDVDDRIKEAVHVMHDPMRMDADPRLVPDLPHSNEEPVPKNMRDPRASASPGRYKLAMADVRDHGFKYIPVEDYVECLRGVVEAHHRMDMALQKLYGQDLYMKAKASYAETQGHTLTDTWTGATYPLTVDEYGGCEAAIDRLHGHDRGLELEEDGPAPTLSAPMKSGAFRPTAPAGPAYGYGSVHVAAEEDQPHQLVPVAGLEAEGDLLEAGGDCAGACDELAAAFLGSGVEHLL